MTVEEPPAVRLTGAGKRYGNVTALEGIELAIQPGRLTVLLGRNGAGKSSLVGLLLGRFTPDAGTVTVFGADPRDRVVRARRGTMLQTAELPPQLTVAEQVGLFGRYYPNPRPLAETLRLAGLAGLERRRCGALSGGQRRRVQFALAICGRPDLLVLDEPTVALDLEARREVWTTIRALVAGGTTVVLTTHHMEEAEALADRIVVLDRGRILADGDAGTVKALFAARTIRCATALEAPELLRLPAVQAVDRAGRHALIRTTDGTATLRALLLRDPGLTDLTVTEPGLEEAFLAITAPGSPDPEQKAA